MSHFVCGTFESKTHPLGSHVEFSYDLMRAAVEHRLSIQLGCNIVQRIVSDVLRNNGSYVLPFFFTESPLSNVSDALIAPDPYESGERARKDLLSGNFQRVASVIQWALQQREVSEARLFCFESVGSAEPFQTIAPDPVRLPAQLLAALGDALELPNLCFVVRT